MKHVLAAAFVFSAGVAQAGGPVVVADDPVVEAPAEMASDFDWTGVYAGVSVVSGSFSDGFTDYDTSGYGLQAGYLRDFGKWVIGGELSYSKGDYGDLAPASDWDATRLKLIGGYGAGRLMPYAFVGATKYNVNQATPYSDTMANYGIGARYAFGASGKVVVGLEYMVENKTAFDDNFDLDNREVALRLDYRF
ncbi:outer membrane beta-barrel protein [Tabrizicola sp.]|uniref:outer membrane beta-barrel protein n=1 Tax=Tabrizicola sp. TaxID=2005166 RepID=UPI0035B3B91B